MNVPVKVVDRARLALAVGLLSLVLSVVALVIALL